jgi:hypothetical protein
MTTPEKNLSKSPNPGNDETGFKDGLGRDIPASAFENEPGPPGNVKLSQEGQAYFDARIARLTAGREKPPQT